MAASIGLAVILTALLVFFAPAAQAKVTNGKCADNTGLNLVVDATEVGGKIDVRCIEKWEGGTAWSAFDIAFGLRGTDNFPTSFVCQVGNKPKGEDCSTTDGKQSFWWYSIATNGHWNPKPPTSLAQSSTSPGEWHGLRYVKGTAAPPGNTPTVPSAPKPKPKPKPTETSKPNPKPSSSKSSKPKPSNSKTSKPSSSATSKPGSGSSSTSSSSPSPSDSETSTPSASDSPDSEETKTEKPGDEETAENSDAEEDAQEGTAIPPGDDDTPTQDSWREGDSTAQNVRAEERNSGPPVGTLITIGAIVLLAGAAFVRHRFAKKPESS